MTAEAGFGRMFFAAALWNFGIAFGGLFFYPSWYRLIFERNVELTDAQTAFLFRAFFVAVLLFGVGYYVVALELTKNRGLVWIGIAGKIALFGLFSQARYAGEVSIFAWGVAFGDFLWAIAFYWFLRSFPPASDSSASRLGSR